jgi:hypothetical protein
MTKRTHSSSPETNPTTISSPQLRTVLDGRVIAPDDAGYDGARAEEARALSEGPVL